MRAMSIFLLSMVMVLTSLNANLLSCDQRLFRKEVNLNVMFRHLRDNGAKCKPGWFIYAGFGERSLIANRYAMALWASNKGLKLRNMNTLRLLKSEALMGLKRYEEAIALLKPLAFGNYQRKFRYRAHIKLINSYYLKNGKRKDVNVKYLLSLFKKNYQDKRALYLMMQNSFN